MDLTLLSESGLLGHNISALPILFSYYQKIERTKRFSFSNKSSDWDMVGRKFLKLLDPFENYIFRFYNFLLIGYGFSFFIFQIFFVFFFLGYHMFRYGLEMPLCSYLEQVISPDFN